MFVGSEIAVVYQDSVATRSDDNLIAFDASTNDLKWHRIGISFKGDSITLIFDCTKQITRKLQRSSEPKIATDGLIFMGIQLDEEEEYFLVVLNIYFRTYNFNNKRKFCFNIINRATFKPFSSLIGQTQPMKLAQDMLQIVSIRSPSQYKVRRNRL